MFREELVPKSWWGIVLKQAGELLLQDGLSLSPGSCCLINIDPEVICFHS